MAIYVLGDIQGCFDTLLALLAQIGYRSGEDKLWLVGDLVNRGPRSLDVLRWVAAEPGLRCVLGNHDLHLLARAAGAPVARASDTLDEVLAASDREALVDWLRRRPLLYREGPWVLVHAGLVPLWDLARAEARAREAEQLLAGPEWGLAVSQWRSPPRSGWGKRWRDDLAPAERFSFSLNALTRLRVCQRDGQMDLKFAGPLAQVPEHLRPWFEMWQPPDGATVLFGHWAALGLLQKPGFVGLDTGCVWGRALTAIRLEDGALFQQPAAER